MFNKNSSFIVVYIKDVANTADFYKVIGAKITQQQADKVVVKLGDHEIHFVQETTEPFAEYQYATKPEGRGQGILFYVETDEIDALHKKLTESKQPVKSPVKENMWQGKEFLVEDPDGIKIVVYQML